MGMQLGVRADQQLIYHDFVHGGQDFMCIKRIPWSSQFPHPLDMKRLIYHHLFYWTGQFPIFSILPLIIRPTYSIFIWFFFQIPLANLKLTAGSSCALLIMNWIYIKIRMKESLTWKTWNILSGVHVWVNNQIIPRN